MWQVLVTVVWHGPPLKFWFGGGSVGLLSEVWHNSSLNPLPCPITLRARPLSVYLVIHVAALFADGCVLLLLLCFVGLHSVERASGSLRALLH